jgi:uncharacterized phiE125 gp8 family phage protein
MSSWYPFGGVGPYGTYGNLGLYGALVVYGSLNLTVTSPSQTFVEPLTNAEMYSYLKIPARSPIDPQEDDFITAMIAAAREQAEVLQGRDLVRKQWDLNHDYWPSYRIETRAPLISVDLVQYTDSNGDITVMTEGDGTVGNYVVDKNKQPGVIMPPYNATWPTFTPWPSSSLLFRFSSGYSNTDPWWLGEGQRVKIGMKLLISAWYNNRLPFEKGVSCANEYPFAVTSCLAYGSLAVRGR